MRKESKKNVDEGYLHLLIRTDRWNRTDHHPFDDATVL